MSWETQLLGLPWYFPDGPARLKHFKDYYQVVPTPFVMTHFIVYDPSMAPSLERFLCLSEKTP